MQSSFFQTIFGNGRSKGGGKGSCSLCQGTARCKLEGLQDIENPYIGCGSARRSPCTWEECFQSMFELHNETFNIWSHLLGGLYFAKVMRTGPLPAQVSAGSSAVTYLVSAFAHTFGAKSSRWCDILFRFDRAGIANFLYSSVVSVSLVHYRNHQRSRQLAVVISTLVYTGSLYSFIFRNTKDKASSVGLLAIQSILGTLICLSELRSTKSAKVKRIVTRYLPGAVGSAFVGAILFLAYVPERFKRRGGLFYDYLGNSHNIMHVLVLWASRDAYVGMSKWCREIGYN